MPLLTLTDAQLAYGMSPLLDGAALTVQENERIGLIGRNGTGKSSLLGVIAGTVTLDGGELRRQEGLRVTLVSQEPALPAAASLRESLVALARVPTGEASFEDDREHWRFEAALNEFLHRFQVDADIEPGPRLRRQVKRRRSRWPLRSSPISSCSTSPPTTSTSTGSRSWRRRSPGPAIVVTTTGGS
jgi:ATP-binding cassette subfamily F protein uup